jgi:membrane protease YdiL (CAAX protease family)
MENVHMLYGSTSKNSYRKDKMTEIEQPLSENQPLIKYGWLRAVIFLICATIMTVIFSSAAMIVIALFSGIDPASLSTNARNLIKDLGLPANIILSLFGFLSMLLTAWLFRHFIDRQSFRSLGFSFSGRTKELLFGFMLGFTLVSAGFVVLLLSGALSVETIQANGLLLFGYLIFFLIGSFNEEIMIRGYILTNLCSSMNGYLALFLSSLLFALMHLGNANVTWLAFINILLAGLLLGIYFIHQKNLWLPIGLHFSWNFFQGPVYGFEVSGVNIKGMIIQNMSGEDWLTGGPFGLEGSLIATVLMVLAIGILHLKYRRPDNI